MYQTDDPSRSVQGQLDGWMNVHNHSTLMTKISCLRIPSGVKHRSLLIHQGCLCRKKGLRGAQLHIGKTFILSGIPAFLFHVAASISDVNLMF